MNQENLSLENLKVSNLPELQGWKDKQENLVKENPFVEITDNKTYETACKSRTALLKGRTSLESQDKLVASKLAGFRKEVKIETDKLISITLPHEEKQQIEVKRYESIKENERLERERIENERIAAIKNKIESLETESYELINKLTYKDIDEHVPMSKLHNTGFDFEEYDIVFDQMVERVKAYASTKIDSLIKEENQRIENEKKELELTRSRALLVAGFSFDGNYYFVGEFKRLDMGTILYLSDYDFEEIVNAGKTEVQRLQEIENKLKEESERKAKELQDKLDEADRESKRKEKEAQDKIDSDNLEREQQAEKEKQQVFEIRKNRLSEIGVLEVLNENKLSDLDFIFSDAYSCFQKSAETIFIASTIDFETIISDAKKAIEKVINDEIEKEKAFELRIAKLLEIGLIYSDEHDTYFVAADSNFILLPDDIKNESEEEFEETLSESRQVISDYKLSKADAEKLKKENKARIKRLAGDKKIISEGLEVYFADLHLDTENQETKDFIEKSNAKIQDLKNELLTELNNL